MGGWREYLLFDEEAVMSRGASGEHHCSIVGACREHARSIFGGFGRECG